MEEILDFDAWIAQQNKEQSVQYYVIYDPESGKIKGVWPESSLADRKYAVPIEVSVAESIMFGNLSPSFCYVDPETEEFSMLDPQEMGLTKIDNVLHRIIEKQFSNLKNYDLFLDYDSAENQLTFQLSEKYGGTFISQPEVEIKRKKVFWDVDTQLDFLITDYNDPNIVYEFLSFRMSEIIGQDKIFMNLDIPKKFSIYTNRVLRDCVIEIR